MPSLKRPAISHFTSGAFRTAEESLLGPCLHLYPKVEFSVVILCGLDKIQFQGKKDMAGSIKNVKQKDFLLMKPEE